MGVQEDRETFVQLFQDNHPLRIQAHIDLFVPYRITSIFLV